MAVYCAALILKPVFCGDCKSRNTWKRDKSKDRHTESGKLFLKAFRCLNCGAIAYR